MAQVLVVGIGDFDSNGGLADEGLLVPCALEQLPSVAPAVEGLASQMAKVPGLTVLGSGAVHDLTTEELTRAWRDARQMARDRGDGETLIVHFAGHGVAGSGNHSLFLATRETDRSNAWAAPQVGAWLAEVDSDPGGAPVLLLLDVCGSGRTVMQQLLEGIRAQDRRAWVIAACAPDEKTYQARFTTAAGVVVERLREGRLDLSPALRHVPVETLAREIDRELARSAAAEDRPAQSVLRTVHPEAHVEAPPFLPNPSYRETPGGQFRQAVETGLWQFASAVDPALDPLHFISRASGAPQQQDIAQGCFFTGREEQLGRIKTWLEEDGQPSLMVVTGSPGSGKSALLGVVACLAHPQLREVTRQIATAIPREIRPELNPDVAAVHARQRGPSEVLSSVASQLGLGEEPSRGWTARSVLERIAVQRDTPVTVILDALDEASSDMALVTEVLIPLARARRRSDESGPSGKDPVLCRVLIGMRPWWDRYAALLDELGTRSAHLLDLDDIPLDQRTAELTGYLCDVLETSPVYSGPGTRTLRTTTAEAVAVRLGAQHERGAFLLASLFAHYLVHQDAAPPVDEVIQRIPTDLPAMLDLHLDVLERQHPCMSAVLAAVAHGYGQGMPLEVVHHVAKAFAGDGATEPDLVDTRNALRAAAFYLRFSTDSDGRHLYRFYHQSLVDHLQQAHAGVSRREIFTRVLDTVPGPEDLTARRFGLALPYVLRHAAQYAREAEALDTLLLSASFLIHCDPQLLFEHMDTGSVRAQFSSMMAQSALSPLHEPWQRREWLRHTASVWGEIWLVEALDSIEEQSAQPPQPRILEPRWGTAERQSEQPWDVSHASLVHFSGRWLAVLVDEGRVEVWDARVGVFLRLFAESLGDCLLTALCSGDGPDGPLVAAGTSDGEVFVWGLNSRVLHTHIHTDGHPITALSIGHLRGTPVVMACGGGEVTIYDLPGQRTASMDVLAGWLCDMEADDSVDDLSEPDLDIAGYDCTAVAACTLDGTPAVVAGAVDGALHVWNVDGSRHRTFPGGSQPVTLLQVLEGPGGPFVVTCDVEGARVWDIRAGSQQILPAAGTHPTGSVLFDRDGRPCFVSAGTRTAICVHHLDDPQSTPSSPLQIEAKGHIRALAADGQQIAAVATDVSEAELLSHSQDSPAPVLAPWAGHDRDVVAVAVAAADPHGRVPAVSADLSGHFQVWDASTGTAVLSGLRPAVTAAAAGTFDGAGVVALAYAARGLRGIEIISLDDTGPQRRRRLQLKDPVDAMSIDDSGTAPGITLQTSAGMFVLHPDAESPTYTPVPTLDETDPLPVACYALARCSGQDTTVVGYASDSLARHWGRLTVHTPAEGTRVLATLDETITCVAAGPWGGRDVAAVGTESGEVIILLLATGEELGRFLAHDITTATVDFVHTQGLNLLVTSGEDDYIRVWDPQPGCGLLSETGFPDSLARISVCDDGVFAGFGERVAFFTWVDLTQQASSEDRMGNR